MLNIWYHDQLVGHVRINEDERWEFDYDPDWDLFPIMSQLPLGTPIKKDVLHNRLIEWFMDNLLPEGKILDAYAKSANIRKENTYEMLAEYGGDIAGALSVIPEGAGKPINEQSYTLLSDEELVRKIEASQSGTPMMVSDGRKRMSLAGAQDKMTVRYDDGKLYLPNGYSPSTHILKPRSTQAEYPFAPANEYFCMQLAQKAGLDVPRTDLLSILNERVYLVERYDRVIEDGHVRRLHQIDGCQALGFPKTKKYEDEGGISFQDFISQASDLCADQIKVRLSLINWMIFNYLIGNADAHAKNFSFMVTKEKFEPAKLYDLLCIEVYHQDGRLSSAIGGEYKAGFIEGAHWDAQSLLCGIKPALTRARIKEMAKKVGRATEELIQSNAFSDEEKSFLNGVTQVINTRIEFVSDVLSEEVRKTPSDFEGINDKQTIIDDQTLEAIGVSADSPASESRRHDRRIPGL